MKLTSITRTTRAFLKAGFNRKVRIEYADLCELFGAPDGPSGDGKVKAEWILRTPEGVGSIYDYKSDIAPENNTDWHIGGNSLIAGYIEAAISRYQKGVDLQVKYQTAYEEIMELTEDIRHAVDRQDNRIINNQDEVSWGLLADMNRLKGELTEIADRLNKRGEYHE